MYKPEPEKPLNPTPEPSNAYERIDKRIADLARDLAEHGVWHTHLEKRLDALEENTEVQEMLENLGVRVVTLEAHIVTLLGRIKQLESDRDELFAAMERARIPRNL